MTRLQKRAVKRWRHANRLSLHQIERQIEPADLASAMSLDLIQATIDQMEQTLPHEGLPCVYDAWVKARDIASAGGRS